MAVRQALVYFNVYNLCISFVYHQQLFSSQVSLTYFVSFLSVAILAADAIRSPAIYVSNIPI